MRKFLAIAAMALILSGCGWILKSIPFLLLDPERLKLDALYYQKAKECKSRELDLILFVQRPVANTDEDLLFNDIKMELVIHRRDSPLTLTIYDGAGIDATTGEKIPRTFNEFFLELTELKDKKLKEIQIFLKKKVVPDQDLTLGDLQNLYETLLDISPYYNELIQTCIIGF